ncbi:MAG: hypothetical protein WD229_02115 [Pirellulales bacterium]
MQFGVALADKQDLLQTSRRIAYIHHAGGKQQIGDGGTILLVEFRAL